MSKELQTFVDVQAQIDAAISDGTAGTLELPDLSELSEQEVLLLVMKYSKTTCPITRALNFEQRRNLWDQMRNVTVGTKK